MIRANALSYKEIYSRNIDQAIEGLTANSSTKQIFSSKSPSATTPAFTRSSTCWAKNIDTSPQSIWNDHVAGTAPLNAGGYGGSGTLISPRHIIYANHFRFVNGTKLVFVDMNNNSYIRTLSDSVQVGSTDIQIGLLDSNITNVSFAKILDINIADKTDAGLKLPAFFMDQDRNALIGEFYFNSSANNGICVAPTDSAQRTNFYEIPVGGDSGNPVCLVYENKIILTFSFYFATYGPSFSYYINDINTAMTNLGGGYTATTFKFSDLLDRREAGITQIRKIGASNSRMIFS